MSNFPGARDSAGNAVSHDNTPSDNPVADAGATLGRVLFYDRKISANSTVACASCHLQEFGLSDPRALSAGFAGGLTRRNSMSLANARFYRSGKFFWDERAETLEEQVLMPFQDPVAMGLTLEGVVGIVQAQPYYLALFQDAFGSPAIDADRIAKALAQFVRSIVSTTSRYDAARGQVESPRETFPNFTAQENRGKAIFMTGGGGGRPRCVRCHQSEAFVGSAPRGRNTVTTGSTNNGLDAVSTDDLGVAETTMNSADTGKFKVPSLRNVAVTAPYMHDGRFATLDEVVEHYSTGIQNHPNLHPVLRQRGGSPERFAFSVGESADLVAFLRTMTDDALLSDEKFSDPFVDPESPVIMRVANSASGDESVAGQTWLTISGRNLSTATATWTDESASVSGLPLSVAGTSVRVGGMAASVHSASPARVIVLAPSGIVHGDVEVQVTTEGSSSNTAVLRMQPVAPALFGLGPDGTPVPEDLQVPSPARFDSAPGAHAAAFHADGTPVAAAGAFDDVETRPANPGDVITIYGTGFGATQPTPVDGQAIDSPLPLASEAIVRFGDVAASVAFAGMVSPGIYQITATVPYVEQGDVPVTVEIAGVKSQGGSFVPVKA